MRQPLRGQERVRGNTKRRVMMKAAPPSAFEVIEPELGEVMAHYRVGADVVTTVRSLDMRRTPPGLTPSRRAAHVVVPVIGALRGGRLVLDADLHE
jgi:hypothetical protein